MPRNRSFPTTLEKSIVSIHKKESKQLVKNYRPVSLLPICGKILQRLTYNEVHPYLTDNSTI